MSGGGIGPYLIIAFLAYLIGSIPTGFVVGKLLLGVDPRQYGSGKTGATNMLRVGGTKVSAAVYVLDFIKGIAPVLLAQQAAGPGPAEIVAAVAVLVGHNWSIFIGFTGGRGIAASSGALWGVSPLAGLAATLAGFVTVAVSRYVSLGSIVGTLAGAVLMVSFVVLGQRPLVYLTYAVATPAIIIYSHRDNISRLVAGTERRLGERATP